MSLSTFKQNIRYSETCDNKREEAWMDAVALRYKELHGKCLSEKVLKESSLKKPISGDGSTLRNTKNLRELLPRLFTELNIRTFFDCPCGDWFWAQKLDLSQVQYFGADITPITVSENARCFTKSNINFLQMDWTCSIPPAVDLILVRDVLFHMPDAAVQKVLSSIHRSGSKYLATTSFSKTENQEDFNTKLAYRDSAKERQTKDEEEYIGFRHLNLYLPPYNFPNPPLYIAEENDATSKNLERHVGVWKLPLPGWEDIYGK